MKIERVNIIGTGNLGINLIKHLYKKIKIENIYTHNPEKVVNLTNQFGIKVVSDVTALSPDVDLNILSVRDDAVEGVLSILPKEVPIVHTSGSLGIEELKGFSNSGIMYPLQTFSSNQNIDIKECPFLIEANSEDFFISLKNFCSTNLSQNNFRMNSDQRALIHLAAVFANNFTNNMLAISQKILVENNIDFKILEPLVKESIRKALEIGPLSAQTGPAVRGDEKIIQKHLTLLKDEKVKEIYKLVTQNIQEYKSKA